MKKAFPAANCGELQDSSLESLQEVTGLVTEAEVTVGARVGFLDNLKDSLTNLKYDAEDETTACRRPTSRRSPSTCHAARFSIRCRCLWPQAHVRLLAGLSPVVAPGEHRRSGLFLNSLVV